VLVEGLELDGVDDPDGDWPDEPDGDDIWFGAWLEFDGELAGGTLIVVLLDEPGVGLTTGAVTAGGLLVTKVVGWVLLTVPL